MSNSHSLTKSDFSKILTQGEFSRLSFANLWFVRDYDNVWSNSGRYGLIINKKVGNSVIRHKIARQLRSHFTDKVLLSGSALVIRINTQHNNQGITPTEFTVLDTRLLSKGWIND